MTLRRQRDRMTRSGEADAPCAVRPKLMVCVTEDWFALSHFKPLLRALVSIAREVVVVTRSSGRTNELAALGVRTIEFDYLRSSAHPAKVWQVAKELDHLVARERPDCVHLIALKPIVTAALVLRNRRGIAVGVHLTGLGLLSIATTPRDRLVRHIALTAVRRLVRRRAELAFRRKRRRSRDATGRGGVSPGHVTILGGAGVDPDHFAVASSPAGTVPTVAFVGRMIRSKGVHVLVDAARHLRARGIPVRIDLYGKIDSDNPDAFSRAEIDRWCDDGLVTWKGHVDDVRSVWRDPTSPSWPRSAAKACRARCSKQPPADRPLIVTDVPGCRQFVRDDIEGFVVPPGNAEALADAIARLVTDAALRERMGAAARARVLGGFTEAHVMAAVVDAYGQLLAGGPARA